LVLVPHDFIYGKLVAGITFFAADDLVQLKIISAPKLDAFIHTCCSKIGLRRMKGDTVYCKQVRGNILNQFEAFCIPNFNLGIAAAGCQVIAVRGVLNGKNSHSMTFQHLYQ